MLKIYCLKWRNKYLFNYYILPNSWINVFSFQRRTPASACALKIMLLQTIIYMVKCAKHPHLSNLGTKVCHKPSITCVFNKHTVYFADFFNKQTFNFSFLNKYAIHLLNFLDKQTFHFALWHITNYEYDQAIQSTSS